MKKSAQKKRSARTSRHARIRAKVQGTAERPRLNVFRGLKSVYAQIIDDTAGKTIAAIHSSKITVADAGERTGKVAAAYCVGRQIAESAKKAGISAVIFDRGGNRYHGRVRAVAEGARDGGLQF